MKWYLQVLQNYANFSGRARRKEYWMFVLFNILFIVIATGLDNLLGLTFDFVPYGYIYLAYNIFIIIPSLAAGVRRLHDINKSGWSILISLIPLIGSIILIVWFAREGDSGSNKYGEDPKNNTFTAEDNLVADA
ncbi:DUF805 domain-containing protein [Mangrovivirga sp. M17]|uniref:DUF805 domain-containing protein n=1 Tax=Mangrovivirga halotolerans TaxID=2993936 RepID=A0ABT3RP54_9BACT|nr:DUF805 domain-containing protein [Mangrovivirga halotolerans]MCX2743139.1 DUF805 domain-containing protein [Mangrovivirga halotolerans]